MPDSGGCSPGQALEFYLMNVLRREKNSNYTAISNIFLRDKCLSLKAKGFLAVVMSLPKEWDFSINGICTLLKEGKTAIYNIITELKMNGYCSMDLCQNKNGVITGSNYSFSETPKQEWIEKAKKSQCPNCSDDQKETESKIDTSSEVHKHFHDMLMNLYLKGYLGPGCYVESSLKSRLRMLLRPDVDYDRVKKRILSMDYHDFLRTPYWAAVAEMVRKRDNYKCQECGSTENLNIHHKTYENHGDEIHHLEDLVCLCQKCHEKHHTK